MGELFEDLVNMGYTNGLVRVGMSVFQEPKQINIILEMEEDGDWRVVSVTERENIKLLKW